MTVQEMKVAISRVYQTESWKKKVKNMHDSQVIAIYHDFYNRKILNQVLKKEKPKAAVKDDTKEIHQQLSFFDILN